MKTQDSLNRSSSSERSLEIFIWIAAILVFIIFLIGSSASANNKLAYNSINETQNTPFSAHLFTDETPVVENPGVIAIEK